jgi:histone-lysine N-methyltransferase SETD3
MVKLFFVTNSLRPNINFTLLNRFLSRDKNLQPQYFNFPKKTSKKKFLEKFSTRMANKSFDLGNNSENFLSWLLVNNVYVYNKSTWGRPPHPCVVSNDTTDEGQSSGKGLLAYKNIQQGEKLIEIPLNLALSKEHPLNKFMFGNIETFNEYDLLAIFLIQQRSIGDKSFWNNYFKILPKETDLDLFFRWTIFDSFFLKGSKINSASIYLREKIRSQFFRINNQVFKQNSILFPKTLYNIETWEWALSVLFSRAIFLQNFKKLTLVPYADFLNHNPFSTSYIDAKEIPFSEFLEITMYADKPYNKFDQVFTTYGPKTNLELLLLYGFILERNPFDSTEIRVGLSPKDNFRDSKKFFLFSCEKTEMITFPLFYYQYPKELYEFLRLCLNIPDKHFENNGQFDFDNNLDFGLEKIIKQVITKTCQKNLQNFHYFKNEKKSQKLIENELFFSKTQKIAFKQIKCEKKILKKIIDSSN